MFIGLILKAFGFFCLFLLILFVTRIKARASWSVSVFVEVSDKPLVKITAKKTMKRFVLFQVSRHYIRITFTVACNTQVNFLVNFHVNFPYKFSPQFQKKRPLKHAQHCLYNAFNNVLKRFKTHIF